MSSRRYCVITPCRDEARFARRTLESMIQQTEPPALWVIVDDGSRDETPAILAEYAARVPWIRVVPDPTGATGQVGGGVIEAFYAGFETVDLGGFDYLCKLDLDLDLPRGYFAGLMDRMEVDPRIGCCSGKPYYVRGDPGADVPLPSRRRRSPGLREHRRRHVRRGEQVLPGRLLPPDRRLRSRGDVGWDRLAPLPPAGMDRHVVGRPRAPIPPPPAMGTSHKNWWTGRARHGSGQYFMGTSPLWMLASALYRMTRPPLLLGGLAMLHGYARSSLAGAPRYGDEEFRRFLPKLPAAVPPQGQAACRRQSQRPPGRRLGCTRPAPGGRGNPVGSAWAPAPGTAFACQPATGWASSSSPSA